MCAARRGEGPMTDKAAKAAAFIRLYEDMRAERDNFRDSWQDVDEELDGINTMCREAMGNDDRFKPWKSGGVLVSQCLDAWADDRAALADSPAQGTVSCTLTPEDRPCLMCGGETRIPVGMRAGSVIEWEDCPRCQPDTNDRQTPVEADSRPHVDNAEVNATALTDAREDAARLEALVDRMAERLVEANVERARLREFAEWASDGGHVSDEWAAHGSGLVAPFDLVAGHARAALGGDA